MATFNRREFLQMSAIGGLGGLLSLIGCTKRVDKTIASTGDQKSDNTPTPGNPTEVLPTGQPTLAPTATADGCPAILFNSEIYRSKLRDTWRVFEGNPVIRGKRLILSGANIQSKDIFTDGILHGEIYSPDWKPQDQFTDSSFGFEIWSGMYNQCHCGILFKANGHLAVLRSQPDGDGKCLGDPLYQDYPPIPDWDTIRAGKVVSFILSWQTGEVVLKVSGNNQEGQVSYSNQAIPDVPLGIRLYAQTNETYEINNLFLCAQPAVYQPETSR